MQFNVLHWLKLGFWGLIVKAKLLMLQINKKIENIAEVDSEIKKACSIGVVGTVNMMLKYIWGYLQINKSCKYLL